ncbi:MAG: right-handed parallel beta-helix repeat-containing protein [Candidatus Electrothrix aestuarii]|uniref:Right-handed parallel beta-helix repeat-containing protein n=1 Tax=Candidatus Electrothrix aestuarii TaxID=3062594 RepID=A0AAU8LXK1_9BACT|nr:right-handed parallel beta-helix repeat-containing protein [Candidatus Electrothrix aestuarii]
MSRTALAFMSYVNDDDRYANGKITQFREHLSRAVKAHSGKPFEIFQDKKDIKWGQQWQERINDALDATLFLIPIITPSFFNSVPCREELERFLKREEELGRGDLILPVYYLNCPVLNDKERLKQDPLAEIIAARQREDWRELRHHSFNTRKLNKALEKMARQIMAALERSEAEASRLQPEKDDSTPASSNTFTNTGSGKQSIAQGANSIGTQINNYYSPSQPKSKPKPSPAAKTEPPTVIVDKHNRSHYKTITRAIQHVNPGTRILVRSGLYRENIIIDKTVEIVGDGKRENIVIQSRNEDAILFKADKGKVTNLTLRPTGRGVFHGVNIIQGELQLEQCDIESKSLSCVAIQGSANPRLRRNRIHNGKQAGIFVYGNGQGILEDNEIFANAHAGVEIVEGGNPILRRNRISKNGWAGVHIGDGGGGIIEDNDLWGNIKGAWCIEEGCAANVQRRGNKE